MRSILIRSAFSLLLGTFWPWAAQGDVRLPAIFSDHMVLQQGRPVTVWGWAQPGETVSVTVPGQKVSAIGGLDGKWSVTLQPLEANRAFELIVAGRNTIRIRDVLVGEVWLASGQSNMAFRLQGATNADAEITTAKYPGMRLFLIEEQFGQKAAADVRGKWQEVTPDAAPSFSAVAYFFGRELHRDLKTAVGIIVSSVGGTRIESWMAPQLLSKDPLCAPAIQEWSEVAPDEFKRIAQVYREYQERRTVHAATAAEAKAKGLIAPPAPVQPAKRCHDCPGALYNGMIAPLVPYTIRGFIWYQGESNTSRPSRYDTLFPAMIRQWRHDWSDEKLPFYFVQLANYAAPGVGGGYARLRESQRRALAVPDTGMAVAIDIGEANDIHPRNKQEVGRRLALLALNQTYGMKSILCSGPSFSSVQIQDDTAVIRFDHTDGMLTAKGPALIGFELAGSDHKFFPATAEISGREVRLRSEKVPNPVTARYAWADNPEGCNLYNGAGLPASPFTTATDLE